MSLINEALKKAQRDRVSASLPPMPGGGSRPGRGSQKPSASTLVLIGSAGVVLFVLCVVATVFFLNRQPAAKPVAVVAKSPLALAPETAASSPMIVMPAIAKPSPAPTPDATPAATPSPSPSPSPAPAVAVVLPGPTPSPASSSTVSLNLSALRNGQPAADKFDSRLQTLVDGWRVTAVRSSGSESKLFMNGNVYRMNDVIDRASGLRLTNVAAGTLTFTDAEGVVYVKRY